MKVLKKFFPEDFSQRNDKKLINQSRKIVYNLSKVLVGEGHGSCLCMVHETATENEEPEPHHSMVYETE